MTADLGDGERTFIFPFTHTESRILDDKGTLGFEESWREDIDIPPYAYRIDVRLEWTHPLEGTPVVNEYEKQYRMVILDRDAGYDLVADADGAAEAHNSDWLYYSMKDPKSHPPYLHLDVAADTKDEAESLVDEYMRSDEVQANGRNWAVDLRLDRAGLLVEDLADEWPWEFFITVDVGHYTFELKE